MVSTAGAPHNSLTFANAELLREFCGNLKGAASFIPLGIDLPRRDLNRVSLSYFSPPVRAVSIPKKSGGERILGVPTVADRVAQMVVKQLIEPDLDPIFLPDSEDPGVGRSTWATACERSSRKSTRRCADDQSRPDSRLRAHQVGSQLLAELCRREGIAESMYYSWSKEWLK